MQRLLLLLALLALTLAAACGQPTPTTVPPPADSGADAEHIQVQHILIAFKESLPDPSVTRTRDEAKALADRVFAEAKSGADFDQLVQQHTNDQAPGIYGIANNGVQPAQGEFPRNELVAAFGDVGFSLKVGEIGMAEFDPIKSPFGWHIIKRLK